MKYMFQIKLPAPMCTLAQVKAAAEATGLDEKELDLLNRGARCVVVEDKPELHAKKKSFTPKDIVLHQNEEWEKQCAKFGADGLVWLLGQNGYQLNPVASVDIPVEVFYAVSESQWKSISSFATQLENRCNRYRRLQELTAPMIIMYNEYRELWKRFERLESNSVGEPERWSDGLIKRSLNDVGYSVVSGWQDGGPEFSREKEPLKERIPELKSKFKYIARSEGGNITCYSIFANILYEDTKGLLHIDRHQNYGKQDIHPITCSKEEFFKEYEKLEEVI